MTSKLPFKVGLRTIPLVTNLPAEKVSLQAVSEFKPLQDWAEALAAEEAKVSSSSSSSSTTTTDAIPVKVKQLEVTKVDYFGSKKIGFLNLSVDAELTESGQKPPGIVFMRGGAVAVLLILRSKDETASKPTITEHVVLTKQARLSIPSFDFPEIPAGMLDGQGDFVGKCAEELQEECGITLDRESLIDMTELAYGDKWKGVYPSAGGCDEFLRLFLCRKDVSWTEKKALEGRLGGLREHGESITLSLVELRDAYRCAPDAKLLSSLALYEALKRDGNLPE